MDKISTDGLAVTCNLVKPSSGRASVAPEVSRRMAPMPYNPIEDGIAGLEERLQASQNVKCVLVHHDDNTDTIHTRATSQRISNETPK
jgi:hypothetical protein